MREVRRLLGFVRPYWRSAVLALTALGTLVAMDLAIPRLIQHIIDHGIARGDRSVIVTTSLLMLGISALSTVIAIGNNGFSVRVGENVARDLREALFLRIQRLSFGNLDRQKTGELLVRLTSDVNAIKALTQVSLRIGTRAPLLMLGSLVLMFTTSRSLALTISPLIVVAALLVTFFVKRMERSFRLVQRKLDRLNVVLQENIAGARLVKALVRADFEGERFELANEAMTTEAVRVMRFMATMTPSLTLCINLGVIAVIWSGGKQAIQGELSTGQIVAFTNYLLTTMSPLLMLTLLSNTWAAGFASLKRVSELLDTAPDVQDGPGAEQLVLSAAPEVVFDDVSFKYAGESGEPVLRDIGFCARPGMTVAILGATGAGKSTLVGLIPRFYEVSSGAVRVAGKDVRSLAQHSLAAAIGWVPQDSILFSGTVRDNIRYGRPEASDDEVMEAARSAQAHEFIARMRQGYDSPVEQRGANFSGGQKQRIAIARALLLRPKILILDDSTSAVDVETEAKIRAALAETKHERTTFVVAQRITSVLDADLILVLDKGRIVAAGSHAELLRSSAVYREIYDSQLGAGPSAGGALELGTSLVTS